jgi:cardiolipin synthase
MKIHHGLTKDIWTVMLDAIRNAKKTIWFEQYLIGGDDVAIPFHELLCQKAQEGVEVKCIFDALGSFYLGRSPYLEKLTRAGVGVQFFNWLRPFAHHNQKFLYFRNHRRLLIIDGETAFTGGVCIGNRMALWQETAVEATGPVVEQMKEVFLQDWYQAQKIKRRKKRLPSGGEGFYFFTSTPLPRQRMLYHRLINAIRQAKLYIYLNTPYFLPDFRLGHALTEAAKRGVDVRVLVPFKTDQSWVDRGSHTYYDHLLLHGVKIYRAPFMVHDKTAVIDDVWATVGSLNLDNVSLRYNLEANLVSTDSRFALEIKANFLHDLEKTKELTLSEWRKRSYLEQWWELLVWPIRKLL